MKALNVLSNQLNSNSKIYDKTKYGINPQIFLPKFCEVIINIQQDFPKTASIIKDLLVKTPALQ